MKGRPRNEVARLLRACSAGASSAERSAREQRGRLLSRAVLGVLAAAAVTMCCKRGSARMSARLSGRALNATPHCLHASFNPPSRGSVASVASPT
ncbi:hypothetical protein SKAU_G00054980 [Synaphobranchus kaupii]|uniref:Uncharacterized protein n=1 Tax=Synaphobranchus kaupii TaxID=118154 RepID=A0A9Q1G3P4_SYNKA|nr:hypothetical protein SKAU_G00054980 [Synaphobranchus kaupii]